MLCGKMLAKTIVVICHNYVELFIQFLKLEIFGTTALLFLGYALLRFRLWGGMELCFL